MTADSLIEEIQQDMRIAMKGQMPVEVDALKSLLARISNAEAVTQNQSKFAESSVASAGSGVGSTEAQRRKLSHEDILTIIQSEVDEIDSALERLPEPSSYGSELENKRAAVQRYL